MPTSACLDSQRQMALPTRPRRRQTLLVAVLLGLLTLQLGCLGPVEAQWTTNPFAFRGAGVKSDETVKAMAVDAAGNTYVVGDFFSPTMTLDTFTLRNKQGTTALAATTSDCFLAKVSKGGQVEWAFAFGGDRDERAFDIALDPSGNNAYVVGLFKSQTVTFNGAGPNMPNDMWDPKFIEFNCFLLKVSSAGRVLWTTQTGDADIASIVVDQAHKRVFIAGTFPSFELLGFDDDPSAMSEDDWSFDDDDPFKTDDDLTTALKGNSLFGGGSSMSSGSSFGQDVSTDVYVDYYSTVSGDLVGGTIYTGDKGDFPSDLAILPDIDALFTTGYFYSPELKVADRLSIYEETVTADTRTKPSAFLTRGDTDSGDLVWAKSFGAVEASPALQVAADAVTKTVYVSGNFLSPVIIALAGGSKAALIRVAADTGQMLWAKSLPTPYNVAVDYLGYVFVAGIYSGAVTLAPGVALPLTVSQGGELYLTRLTDAGTAVVASKMGGGGLSAKYGVSDLKTDGAGNVYMGGNYSAGSLTLATGTAMTLPTPGSNFDAFFGRVYLASSASAAPQPVVLTTPSPSRTPSRTPTRPPTRAPSTQATTTPAPTTPKPSPAPSQRATPAPTASKRSPAPSDPLVSALSSENEDSSSSASDSGPPSATDEAVTMAAAEPEAPTEEAELEPEATTPSPTPRPTAATPPPSPGPTRAPTKAPTKTITKPPTQHPSPSPTVPVTPAPSQAAATSAGMDALAAVTPLKPIEGGQDIASAEVTSAAMDVVLSYAGSPEDAAVVQAAVYQLVKPFAVSFVNLFPVVVPGKGRRRNRGRRLAANPKCTDPSAPKLQLPFYVAGASVVGAKRIVQLLADVAAENAVLTNGVTVIDPTLICGIKYSATAVKAVVPDIPSNVVDKAAADAATTPAAATSTSESEKTSAATWGGGVGAAAGAVVLLGIVAFMYSKYLKYRKERTVAAVHLIHQLENVPQQLEQSVGSSSNVSVSAASSSLDDSLGLAGQEEGRQQHVQASATCSPAVAIAPPAPAPMPKVAEVLVLPTVVVVEAVKPSAMEVEKEKQEEEHPLAPPAPTPKVADVLVPPTMVVVEAAKPAALEVEEEEKKEEEEEQPLALEEASPPAPVVPATAAPVPVEISSVPAVAVAASPAAPTVVEIKEEEQVLPVEEEAKEAEEERTAQPAPIEKEEEAKEEEEVPVVVAPQAPEEEKEEEEEEVSVVVAAQATEKEEEEEEVVAQAVAEPESAAAEQPEIVVVVEEEKEAAVPVLEQQQEVEEEEEKEVEHEEEQQQQEEEEHVAVEPAVVEIEEEQQQEEEQEEEHAAAEPAIVEIEEEQQEEDAHVAAESDVVEIEEEEKHVAAEAAVVEIEATPPPPARQPVASSSSSSSKKPKRPAVSVSPPTQKAAVSPTPTRPVPSSPSIKKTSHTMSTSTSGLETPVRVLTARRRSINAAPPAPIVVVTTEGDQQTTSRRPSLDLTTNVLVLPARRPSIETPEIASSSSTDLSQDDPPARAVRCASVVKAPAPRRPSLNAPTASHLARCASINITTTTARRPSVDQSPPAMAPASRRPSLDAPTAAHMARRASIDITQQASRRPSVDDKPRAVSPASRRPSMGSPPAPTTTTHAAHRPSVNTAQYASPTARRPSVDSNTRAVSPASRRPSLDAPTAAHMARRASVDTTPHASPTKRRPSVDNTSRAVSPATRRPSLAAPAAPAAPTTTVRAARRPSVDTTRQASTTAGRPSVDDKPRAVSPATRRPSLAAPLAPTTTVARRPSIDMTVKKPPVGVVAKPATAATPTPTPTRTTTPTRTRSPSTTAATAAAPAKPTTNTTTVRSPLTRTAASTGARSPSPLPPSPPPPAPATKKAIAPARPATGAGGNSPKAAAVVSSPPPPKFAFTKKGTGTAGGLKLTAKKPEEK